MTCISGKLAVMQAQAALQIGTRGLHHMAVLQVRTASSRHGLPFCNVGMPSSGMRLLSARTRQRPLLPVARAADAPSLTDDPGQTEGRPGGGGGPPSPRPPPGRNNGAGPSQLKIVYNRVLRRLSSLKLAIAELAAIAALSSIGTVLPQDEPLSTYQRAFPSDGRLFDWYVITLLEWDHIYSSPYFLLLMAMLAASLMACTLTRQWPAVKVARRWRFIDAKAVDRMEDAEVLPSARINDLAAQLAARKYQVFNKDGRLYAFKGLAGKLGPIGVHASMVLAMLGVAFGVVGGYKGSLFLDEGSQALLAAVVRPNSGMAPLPSGARSVLQVNDFTITYRPDGSVGQFFTDLSVRDLGEGEELYRKTISVNDPLRWGGLTLYQTDWGMAALDVQVDGLPFISRGGGAGDSGRGDNGGELPVVRLPMAEIQSKLGVNGKTWATFLPLEAPKEDGTTPRGLTLLAQDFQSVVVYDSAGNFVGVRRPGSGKELELEGVRLVVNDIVGSSGMELKADPGIPFVYAGFGGLMLTTVISYLSHSQVWAAQQGRDVHVAGKSNRDKLTFDNELEEVLNSVPEVQQ